jgi:hypothetical protein
MFGLPTLVYIEVYTNSRFDPPALRPVSFPILIDPATACCTMLSEVRVALWMFRVFVSLFSSRLPELHYLGCPRNSRMPPSQLSRNRQRRERLRSQPRRLHRLRQPHQPRQQRRRNLQLRDRS